MRFYALVIRFLRIINELYFVEIRTTGVERIPRRGPVILAANHPGSILDSIVLATEMPRTIHYLARSGLFRFPPLAALFSALGAIPIYRAHETSDSAERNVAVFGRVFQLLARGGCVGIFPEGRNSPPGRIGELRQGAARLALGALQGESEGGELVIVPVGINFENRGFLMSAVLLRCGTPLRVADYRARYLADPEGAAADLTADLKAALERQVLTIENVRLGHLVDELVAVFGDQLDRRFEATEPETSGTREPGAIRRWLWRVVAWYRRATPESSRAFERRMISRQHIRDVLVTAWSHHPRRVVALRNRLESYKDHLRQTELRNALTEAFNEPVRQRLIRLRMTVYAVVVAPLAAFGLIHNGLPYLLTRALGRLSRDDAVRAFTLFGVGTLSFGLTYGLIGYGLWQWSPLTGPQSLAYVAALPPTGFVALRYRRNLLVFRDRILLRTLFWNRRELVDLLRRERARIYADFEALQ